MLGNILAKKECEMAEKIPRVSERWLYGAELPEGGIELDSEAWFAWLEGETSLSFSYPMFDPACGYIIGFMTVRKERNQRGRLYWSAYRGQQGRLRKRYLGATRRVTQARLNAVALAFRQEGAAQWAAEVARQEEEAVQWQEPPTTPQPPREEGRALLILDVTGKESRNMASAVRAA